MARRIIDGDTFETTTKGGEDIVIRLANVGAPELGQPGAIEAAQKLGTLLGPNAVSWKRHAIDSYGRWVCDVENADGIDVNQEMREFLDGYFGR